MIGPLTEQLFAPGFDRVGMMLEVQLTGEGLGIDPLLPVDVCRRTRGPTFYRPQTFIRRPKFPSDIIRVAAIGEKVTGITPVPIILTPQTQSMLVSRLTQPPT